MEKLSSEQSETSDRVLEFDLSAELRHGIAVSNLAYALSKELGLPHEQCYDLAIAGHRKAETEKLYQRAGK